LKHVGFVLQFALSAVPLIPFPCDLNARPLSTFWSARGDTWLVWIEFE